MTNGRERPMRVFKKGSRVGARIAKFTLIGGALTGLAATAMTGSSTAASSPRLGHSVQASTTDTTAQPPSVFIATSPVRVLDTRGPIAGGPIGVPTAAKLGPNARLDLRLSGDGFAVPATATAVLLNVTIDDDASLPSYLTVWPSGEAQPFTSVNNALPGLIASNSTLAKLGTNGAISIYNQRGDVNVVIDLVGYTVPVSSIGLPGSQLLSGTGAPTAATGRDGDFYLDQLTKILYGPKTGGMWPVPGIQLGGPAALSTFNDTPAAISAGGAFTFPTVNDVSTGPAAPITHVVATPTNFVLTTGTYRVSYRVSVGAALLGSASARLTLGGVGVGSTNSLLNLGAVGVGATATDTFLVKVAAPSAILQLTLPSAVNVTLASASIDIEQIP